MIRFIHLSDLHLRAGWHEEQGVVLSALLKDLQAIVTDGEAPYLVFSGDIVQAGASSESFQLFHAHFDEALSALGIDRSRRVLVPGNHDMSRDVVHENFHTFFAIRARNLDEKSFNDAAYGEFNDILRRKFQNYLNFEQSAAAFGLSAEHICGVGHDVRPGVGLYALNTALFSFGGLINPDDAARSAILDEGFLMVETRRLYKWLQSTQHELRILVMHHPVDALCSWAKHELQDIIDRYFNVVLIGHVHKADARYVSSTSSGSVICVAPALFTRKANNLGYSLITIDDDMATAGIQYRHLSRTRKFVSGTYFSGTEDGAVRFSFKPDIARPRSAGDATMRILRANFERAATCAPSIGHLWVPPTLGEQPETARGPSAETVDADFVLREHQDMVIYAPPQFGLTTLGRFLASEAWRRRPGEATLYFQAEELPNHEAGILRRVRTELAALAAPNAEVTTIILDDFNYESPLSVRKMKSIKRAFGQSRLLLLCKLDASRPVFLESVPKEIASFKFLYLWSLTRSQIRSLADGYVDAASSAIDVNDLVDRCVENLEKLNLHRAPLNVVTLFRIADSAVDISPVNRTEMCERFLFLLFTDFAQLPRYGTKPDLKDSIYALGAFCECLIRRSNITFTKEEFYSRIVAYCDERLLSIEVDVLFMFLVEESLVIRRGGRFSFRFLYWLYFFAAHRMYHDGEFADYILRDRNYAQFPEIIEFYSGIDRRRVDLIKILEQDLGKLLDRFSARFDISLSFDPYQEMAWTPSAISLDAVHKEILDEAAGSGLPTVIKDQLADRLFDWSRAYSQEIRSFVSDSSLGECMRVCVAASTALRNSDHAAGEAKRDLYDKILESWTRLVQLGVMIAPILAKHDNVHIEGIRFILDKGAQRELPEDTKFWNIMMALPESVARAYDKDIGSRRMAPLFSRYMLSSDASEMVKLLSAFLIISSRPAGWRENVEKYILGLDRHSVYMLAVLSALLRQLRYGFHSREDKRHLIDLVGVAVARHETGSKKPNQRLIEKASKAALAGEWPIQEV